MKQADELDEQGFDKDGVLHALPPEKVDQTLEGERLNKLEHERIQRAKEEKQKNPEGKPAETPEETGETKENHSQKARTQTAKKAKDPYAGLNEQDYMPSGAA